MHEYSIVSALVDRVEREAAARGAARVAAISVRIGALSGVETTLLATAFETFRDGTICEGATMTIVDVPAAWSCSACETPVAAGEVLRCAACDAPARLTAGDEIILDRVELEVPATAAARPPTAEGA